MESVGRRLGQILVNFFVRAVLGMALIFFVNELLKSQGSSVRVGMNVLTLLTSGLFGIPGVALLYGICFFKIL